MRQTVSSGSEFEASIGYSRAVVDGDMIYVSGTTGFDYSAGTISPDVTEQARQAIANIEQALGEARATLGDVLRVRYYVTEQADFATITPILGHAFGAIRPAATAVVCGLIDPAMKVEIEVTARRGSA